MIEKTIAMLSCTLCLASALAESRAHGTHASPIWKISETVPADSISFRNYPSSFALFGLDWSPLPSDADGIVCVCPEESGSSRRTAFLVRANI